MTQPSADGADPYGGYGGGLQQFGRTTATPADRNAPPPRVEPYTGPPLPPPGTAGNSWPAVSADSAVPGVQPTHQRPAVLTMSATLAVTASLQWICGLSLAWLVAAVGASSLGTTELGGVLFHSLQRFHYRMIDGLAWPLYLLPLASFITGFVVLARQPLARIVHSGVGVIALAWSAWWLRDHLLWWSVAALYVAVACLITWLPQVTRWYRSAPSD